MQNKRFGLPASCLFNDQAVMDFWGSNADVHKSPNGNIGGVSSSARNANDTAADFSALFEGQALTPERYEKIKNCMAVVTDVKAGGRLKDVIPKERL